MCKFGEGKYYYKDVCKYNGITYKEVLPICDDIDKEGYIICDTTSFGSRMSFPKDKIVSVVDHSTKIIFDKNL